MQHIQAAVRFVRDHNIRLVVKNTGHCFLGRSVAPDSLQILTHHLKNIDFVDNFQPQGCTRNTDYGSAITVIAGMQLKHLYTALGQRNFSAVIGAAHTVGIAGGYIQGGGHSPLGPWKGMAADNTLEFTVVTASGDLVVANDFQNSDLFWALRGGGGGSWGVVASVTIRTFPDPPVAVEFLNINTTNPTAFWDFISDFHAALPAINDASGSGYYFITSAPNLSISIALLFANHTTPTNAAAVLDPLIANANKTLSPSSVVALRTHAPSLVEFILSTLLPGESDDTGSIVRIGSRLVSREFLSHPSNITRLTASLEQYFHPDIAGPNSLITGHIVAGGQVARNSDNSTSINPAWRRTITHLVGGVTYPPDASIQQQEEMARRVTERIVPLFKKLEPDMGAYLNEADAEERNWQGEFWGHGEGGNYAPLKGIKRRWDPEGVFITRRGVGSEEWDEEGACRA